MKDDNISKFEVINFDEIKESINNEYQLVVDDLEDRFTEKERLIKKNIENCKSNEDSFKKLVDENKDLLDELIKDIEKKCNRFDAFLTKNNKYVIDNLNLKELEEDKKNFEENMSQFEKANMENNTDTINEFITEKSFLFFFKVFDKQNTLSKYKNKVNNFFNNKDNILSIIEKK